MNRGSQFRCVKAPKRFAEKLRWLRGVNPGIDVASWDKRPALAGHIRMHLRAYGGCLGDMSG